MVYCPKCGTKNEDDATFCKSCGAGLDGRKHGRDAEMDKRCEEECAGGHGGRGWAIFWGIIIILIGLTIIFEVIVKGMAKTISWLSWVNSVEWGWVFAGVIAIFIILFGVRILSRR